MPTLLSSGLPLGPWVHQEMILLAATVTQCFGAPLLSTQGDNVLMTKDNTVSKWNSDSYAGAWLDFGGYGNEFGWTVNKVMIDNLQETTTAATDEIREACSRGTFTFTETSLGQRCNSLAKEK
ncbi:MAG: hypothetical protein R2758_05180 [Bacteroidales bacterium]